MTCPITPERRRAVTDEEAVEIMRPFVTRFAKRLVGRWNNSLVDDLVQAGLIAAVQQARTFDPTRGFKFVTHAALRVRGAVLDHLRELDPLARTHRREVGDTVAVVGLSLRSKWHKDNGDQASTESSERGTWRIDPPCVDADVTDDPADEFAGWLRREFPGRLFPDQIRLLCDYYVAGLTMLEIAHRDGLCESRVSQRMAAALDALNPDRPRGSGGMNFRDAARRERPGDEQEYLYAAIRRGRRG